MINGDLWSYLAQTDKPIVMYGMGNGADKILSVLEGYNVKVADFFASDGFVRGHSFHGKRVLSFSEIKEKYDSFIILLSFGSSLPEVLKVIYDMSEQYEMYAPDVPVAGKQLFTYDFYLNNYEKIKSAEKLLADEKSVSIYNDVIAYKLSGRIDYLRSSFVSPDDVFKNILDPASYRTYVDLGAYNGDTVRQLLSYGATPEKIVAFEPDRKNFKKLALYAEGMDGLELYNAAAWSANGSVCFSNEGNRNSGVSASGTPTECLCLDSIESARLADYIKYDVEGSELEALKGSADIIKNRAPDLLVSLYHRSEDVFSLVEFVKSLNPQYKLYIRRFEYVPAWDLCLIATVK